MMHRPFAVPVALPRGPEHYWKTMQALDEKGFTVRDIALCADGSAHATVKNYVQFLVRKKILVKVGARKEGYVEAGVYRIKTPQRFAPVMHRTEYLGARGAIQRALWTAMRSLSQFSLPELAATASTEEHPVKLRTAEEYVRRLRRVGVVEDVKRYQRSAPGASGAKAGVYRLVRAHNSGPLPPKVFSAQIVFDPNKNRVLGEALVSEAQS